MSVMSRVRSFRACHRDLRTSSPASISNLRSEFKSSSNRLLCQLSSSPSPTVPALPLPRNVNLKLPSEILEFRLIIIVLSGSNFLVSMICLPRTFANSAFTFQSHHTCENYRTHYNKDNSG